MEPFKNIYNSKSLKKMAKEIGKNDSNFNQKAFCQAISKELDDLEMKDRVRLISRELYNYLPKDYSKACSILIKSLAENEKENEDGWDGSDVNGITGFMVWPLTQFVETYGLEEFDISMNALYEMTKRFSAEFAIRPFLIKYDKKVFTLLKKWRKDKSHHVRRLVSEGTRPNLPWGLKVPNINNELSRNIELIFYLKNDSSEYVRKSVANHLNDISHKDEKLFLKTLKEMKDGTNEVDWLIRHATRTLLKKGHPEALKFHGYNPKAKVNCGLTSKVKSIREGDKFEIQVDLENLTKSKQKLIVDYIIHYPKKNGELSPKVFRLKDTILEDTLSINKQIHFKKVTTRKHYPGRHFLEIQVNGKKYGQIEFILKE